MLDLPILNVRLNPCHEDWQQMTPTAQGRHCASCQRTVHDFTTATQADLKAARAAAPDGRLCGRFRQAQLAPAQVQLRPKLRRFVVALVLVCGLGMTSSEAWAQVRKAEPTTKRVVRKHPPDLPTVTVVSGGHETGIILASEGAEVPAPDKELKRPVYTYVEQMPVYKDGGPEGLRRFVTKNLRWPRQQGLTSISGKVFVSFILTREGRVQYAKVLKGIHPAFDAEALRVVQLLDRRFAPGKQHNATVDVRYTVPITFSRE